MNKNEKIFVAGGSGLVGSAVLRKLLGQGYTNVIASYYVRPLDGLLQSIVRSVEVDLTDQKATINFFRDEKPDYVFLAAARVGGIVANNTYKAEFIYQNIMIASNVIDASYRHGVKKLLNLGSSCIYPKMALQPMKEEYLLTGELESTNEPYAIAKIAAIKLCRYYNEQYGTNFISVMPTNLYGPNDNFDLLNSHVLPAMIRKFRLAYLLENGEFNTIRKDFILFGNNRIELNNGKQIIISENSSDEDVLLVLDCFGIGYDKDTNSKDVVVTLWGTGAPYREFLYVDDLADSVVFLMENYGMNEIGEFINIGTGKDIRIKELAPLVQENVGFKGKLMFDELNPDGTPKKLLDVEKLNRLGWNYVTSLGNGIKETYRWYISHFDLADS